MGKVETTENSSAKTVHAIACGIQSTVSDVAQWCNFVEVGGVEV